MKPIESLIQEGDYVLIGHNFALPRRQVIHVVGYVYKIKGKYAKVEFVFEGNLYYWEFPLRILTKVSEVVKAENGGLYAK